MAIYIIPDAKKRLAEWPKVEAEFRARWRSTYAAHKADLSSKKWRRRVQALISEWRTICRERDRLAALLRNYDA